MIACKILYTYFQDLSYMQLVALAYTGLMAEFYIAVRFPFISTVLSI
ncbi:hypothetical protein [Bacillus sp. Bos-x628]